MVVIAVLIRLLFIAAGLGITEIAIGGVFARGSIGDWALLLLGGLVPLVVGTAGFMGPLLAGGALLPTKGVSDDA